MRLLNTALIAGALLLAGCQANQIDQNTTKAIDPVAVSDISAADLKAGKEQFLEANYGLAEKKFRKAVELRGDNAEAWMGLAASYDQLGRYDFAERAYQQLFKIAGRKPQIVSNYGYSQMLRGNKREAKKLFQEAAKAMPDNARINANLKLLSSI
jgi:Flp pilus assembly protein TadD